MRFYCLALLLLPYSGIASAQDQSQVSENTPIAGGREDEGNSWKYFYFHKAGISDEQAVADIEQCYSYSTGLTVMKGGSAPTYSSAPYSGSRGMSPAASAATAALISGVGGLAGAIITGFMDAGTRRAMARTNLRKCFGFKGYSRYEMTKEEHSDLMDGGDKEVRARILEKVTGPTPTEERLVA